MKKGDKLFIATYTQVEALDYLQTNIWRTLRQFRYQHMVNGVEAFYDPVNKLFVQITDFCFYGPLSNVIKLAKSQKKRFQEHDIIKLIQHVAKALQWA